MPRQFRLRSLFILTAIVAVLSLAWSWDIRRRRIVQQFQPTQGATVTIYADGKTIITDDDPRLNPIIMEMNVDDWPLPASENAAPVQASPPTD